MVETKLFGLRVRTERWKEKGGGGRDKMASHEEGDSEQKSEKEERQKVQEGSTDGGKLTHRDTFPNRGGGGSGKSKT